MVQCPDSALPLQGAWIQSLVGEQRSHKPEVQPKKEKEKEFFKGWTEKEDSTKDTRRNSEGSGKSTQRECQGKPSGSVIIRFDYI